MKISLSIIIVSYKNLEVLINCLNSIFLFNDIGERLEVIVVEQSPTKDLYEYLLKEYPKVKLIRSNNNGFGAGNNVGARFASGDYLLFLNPDTVLVEPIGEFTINTFSNNDRLGLFGVKLINKSDKKCSSFQFILPYGLLRKILYKFCNEFDIFLCNSMYIEGADIFIRKSLFFSIGMFDENIFMYSEEPDVCIRVMKHGYNIDYFKNKKIIHLQGACSTGKVYDLYRNQTKSFEYLCRKHQFDFDKLIKKEIRYQKAKLFALGLFNKNTKNYKDTKLKIKAFSDFVQIDNA